MNSQSKDNSKSRTEEKQNKDILIYNKKRKSEISINKDGTKDTSNSTDTPSKRKYKKKVSFEKNMIEYINIESFKKYNIDISVNEMPKKDNTKCHCIVI